MAHQGGDKSPNQAEIEAGGQKKSLLLRHRESVTIAELRTK